MLLSQVCRVILTPVKTTMVRWNLIPAPNAALFFKLQAQGGSGFVRGFKASAPLNNNKRGFFKRVKARLSLQLRVFVVKVNAMVPSTEKVLKACRSLLVLGATVAGMTYYGVVPLPGPELDSLRPHKVKPKDAEERSLLTWAYFAGTFLFITFAAVTTFRCPAMMNAMRNCNYGLTMSTSFTLIIGTAVWEIPYEPGFGTKKQLALVGYCGAVGSTMALFWARLAESVFCRNYCLLLLKTVFVWSGASSVLLTTVAICVPDDKSYLHMAWYNLVMFAAALIDLLLIRVQTLPVRRVYCSTFLSIIVCHLLLCDSSSAIRHAEALPPDHPYDPINMSISIYIEILQIVKLLWSRK